MESVYKFGESTTLQINFIDMPGWSDSGGEEEDIQNMALMWSVSVNQFILSVQVTTSDPNDSCITIDANACR